MNDNEIDKLEHEINEKKRLLDSIKAAMADFPDMKMTSTSRWEKGYKSAHVDRLATDATFYASCGCCDDSPYYVRPRAVLSEQLTVYGNQFCIGGKHPEQYGKIISDYSVRKDMEAAGYSEEVIKKTEAFLKEHAPDTDYDYDYDED